MSALSFFLVVAIPAPFWRYFDYLAPKTVCKQDIQPGMRVKVPFGKRHLIGFVVDLKDHTEIAADKIKSVIEVVDRTPVLTASLLKLTQWASEYYQYPLGEVITAALPSLLCHGKPAVLKKEPAWQLTAAGWALESKAWKRASLQQQCWQYLRDEAIPLSTDCLKQLNFGATTRRALAQKGLIEACEILASIKPLATTVVDAPLTLNTEQLAAYQSIIGHLTTFNVFLLEGVTGSGKTEVYLQTIAEVLKLERQVLVLVPEIGLTPQTVARFKRRFAVEIAVLHSNLSDNERLQTWLKAKQGAVPIIIGTRSALFTPLPHLGLIILDEEHDGSFKQQEGFRYSARDLAIVRARLENIPVLLGSATPSLESYYNARQGRYQHLVLKQRAGAAHLPQIELIDLRKQSLVQGIAPALLKAIKECLAKNEQVLLFLNRRGFAPVLRCQECGWIAGCKRCDARLTLHARDKRLHCHHCDTSLALIKQCPLCQCPHLYPLGMGTQRVEQVLQETFTDTKIIRLDRDSVRRKGELETALQGIHEGGAKILLGTQMLAKGHHFPEVTLVGILDMDSGFFSADFRAPERMSQLLFQVAGRAGRAEKRGKVLIQTYHPTHPLLNFILKQDYSAFADYILIEREQTAWPPFAF